MTNEIISRFFRLLTCGGFVLGCFSVADAADPIDYEQDIAPILRTHCAGCHNRDDAEAGFVVDTPEAMIAGGDSGVAVTPGAASSSRLWLYVSGKLEPKMPPEGEPELSEPQLELIESWIDQGARFRVGGAPMRTVLRTPQIDSQVESELPITAMAVGPQLQAVARFGSIELIAPDGHVVRTMDPLPGKVNSLEFSADGSRVLIATGTTGAFGSAMIIDAESGETLVEMTGHRDILYAATFSPDTSMVATAGYDREIKLWDSRSGELLRTLTGHNGAIFDLAFAPGGNVLVSACADETVKVWNVATGDRLDTLGQNEDEVYAVSVAPDGNYVVAAGADNRLRVWSLVSIDQPAINPLLVSRFVDEAPLTAFQFTPDGRSVVVLSQTGNLKVIEATNWTQIATLEPVPESASDFAITADGSTVIVSLMDGTIVKRSLLKAERDQSSTSQTIRPIYLDLGELIKTTETDQRRIQGDETILVGRGIEIAGKIAIPQESDYYRWPARAGEVWAIDADAGDGSPIDPLIIVLDANDQPVLRTRLQAIRESYFTFRGKNSSQTSDFRMFDWQSMNLDDYLYASGEVTRLFLHPRGPDSGFNVYPGQGTRWTYFGTSHRAHALGEPAYIVRPLASDEDPIANGLPVFDVYYENDDDPMRLAGKNSRLLFTAPSDGDFTVRISDTRGDGGDDFDYRLAIRPASPRMKASFSQPRNPILKGTGREFSLSVDRYDGFDGPVTFEIFGLPAGIVSNSPITIEAGQRFAEAVLWVDESVDSVSVDSEPRVIARAQIGDRMVEREIGTIKKIEIGDRAKAIPSIHPVDHEVPENEAWTLQVRRGETATARILVRRDDDFQTELRFGTDNSARNATHGVYVDNIGLSGLLVRQGENEREFFLTADPVAKPGKRMFHLKANTDGGVTTHPIVVEVLP